MGTLPTWLGVALAACFGLVAVQRAPRRDPPGLVMAAGMAVMALGMAGIGPMFLHGPWWAAGFLAVGLWPLVSRGRAGRVCGGWSAHLVGAVAMVYMCLLPGMAAMTSPTESPELVALTSGHHHALTHSVALPGAAALPGATGTALAVLGWALACYFLLWTVSALTRRDADGGLAVARLAALGEVAMGLGTVVMLAMLT